MLPRLELPAGARLLYEEVVLGDPDRTGNWRFYVREDGCFFSARNSRLWVTGADDFGSDDPALFWNSPFPGKPDRCLTASQVGELEAAIRAADIAALSGRYRLAGDGIERSGSAERWTVVDGGKPSTVVVEPGAAGRN
jgi:hypothetical protein